LQEIQKKSLMNQKQCKKGVKNESISN